MFNQMTIYIFKEKCRKNVLYHCSTTYNLLMPTLGLMPTFNIYSLHQVRVYEGMGKRGESDHLNSI